MPTYVYHCQDCGAQFELLRPMRDLDAPIACQYCHSDRTHRLLTTCNCNHSSSSAFEGSSASSREGGCSGCHGGTCASCGH